MVKLFAPATGAAAVVLASLVVTAGGIVEGGVVVAAPVVTPGAVVADGDVVVWARTTPTPKVLKRRVAAMICFIRGAPNICAVKHSVDIIFIGQATELPHTSLVGEHTSLVGPPEVPNSGGAGTGQGGDEPSLLRDRGVTVRNQEHLQREPLLDPDFSVRPPLLRTAQRLPPGITERTAASGGNVAFCRHSISV